MGRVGGGGRNYVFQLKSDHTGIVQTDGATAAALPTDAAIIFGSSSGNDILTQTDFSYNDDGSKTIKLSQTKFDEALDTFFKTACPRKAGASSSDTEELTDETGRKIGGASGSGTEQQYVMLSFGALGDDGKIPVEISAVYFKMTSGGRSYSGGKWVAPAIEVQSVAAKVAISVPLALFDDAIVTQPAAAIDLLKDYHEVIAWLEPAA